MKYLRLNLQYLLLFDKGKRFLLLALVCLPAALAAAFGAPLSGFLGWFAEYPRGYRNYLQLLSQMFSGFHWWVFVLFLIIAVITASVVMSINYRCLRTGRMNLKNPMRLVNENLIPSFFLVLFTAIAMAVWLGLAVLFVFLFHYIKARVLGQIISIVFLLLWILGLVFFFSTFVLWLPIMSHNGIRSVRALSYAVEKTGSVWHRVVNAMLPVVFFGLALSFGIWFAGSYAASVAIDVIVYDIWFVYLLTLSETVFFDVSGLPREDIPRAYRSRFN